MDEEKKVEAVREFYAHAAENKVASASSDRMLFFGQSTSSLLVAIYVFSPSRSTLLHPCLQCHVLGIWDKDVHERQLICVEFILEKYLVSASAHFCRLSSLLLTSCSLNELIQRRFHDTYSQLVHRKTLTCICGTYPNLL